MTKEEYKAYMKAYYEAHKEQHKAYMKAYYEAHKEQHKATVKAYYEAHKEERKAKVKAWQASHKEQYKDYQKVYKEAHKEEYRTYNNGYMKAYMKSDVNSLGQTKNSIRKKSQHILKQMNLKIPGYEIHHCFGYEDPSKFIYISKELHLKIHQYLRDNNIDASSDHWMQIRDLVNDTDEFVYIKA